jgi:hypothetical protein
LDRDLEDQAALEADDQQAEPAQPQPPAPDEPAAGAEQFQARIEELTQERDHLFVLFVDCDLLDSDQYFLRDRKEPNWPGLQVSSVDFLKTFDVRRAGAVGRPSSFSLIADELDRRIAALRPGEFLGRTADEVETSLSRWVADTHPTRPQCKAKTIRNRLREKILPRIARK